MSKAINATLLTHLAQDSTTTCYLMRVQCVGAFAGTVLGFCTTNADLVYNDGNGAVTYRSDSGFAPDKFQASADMSVDNTDLQGWVSDTGVTQEQIRAGLFDFAKVKIYRVNYLDLTTGRHEIMGTGTCGETQYSRTGWKVEFRSLTQQTKQPIADLYSLTCAAQFGDSRCTKALVWDAGSVASVSGTEPDRIFTATAMGKADGYYFPGVVKWLTGNNAPRESDIDSQVGNLVSLSLSLPFPVQAGDTFNIRQDCDKTIVMCKTRHNNVLNNRSQHLIPVADGGASLIPGAELEDS